MLHEKYSVWASCDSLVDAERAALLLISNGYKASVQVTGVDPNCKITVKIGKCDSPHD